MDPLPEFSLPISSNPLTASREIRRGSFVSSDTGTAATDRSVELSSTRQGAQPTPSRSRAEESSTNRLDDRLRNILFRLVDEESESATNLLPQSGFSRISLTPETTARVDNQLSRFFGDSYNLGSVQNSTGQSESGWLSLSPSGRHDLDSYLQLIRLLSDDPENLERFFEQMDAFMAGREQGGNASFDEFLQQFTDSMSQTSMAISSEASFRIHISVSSQTQSVSSQEESVVSESGEILQADPLVLDLNDNGFELTGVEQGVLFRIDGTETSRQTAFVTGGDAFLALDRNGNGSIDDGGELFGDQHGAPDGIEELRRFDENKDGVIDAFDSIFPQLLLFQDQNLDGLSQANELHSLESEGILSISLYQLPMQQKIAGGNQLTSLTTFQRQDGMTGLAGDVKLNYLA